MAGLLWSALFIPVLAQPSANVKPEELSTPTNYTSFYHLLRQLDELDMTHRQQVMSRYENAWVSPIVENDTLVHFTWYGRADEVAFSSDIDYSWKEPQPMHKIECGYKDLYFRSFILAPDARVDYQFVIDGLRITDPRNPMITPASDGPHSQAAMPGFKGTAWIYQHPKASKGTITEFTFIPKNRELVHRPVKVYLPPVAMRTAHMPSIYVHDGFDAIRFGRYQVLLDNLISTGRMAPAVVVFIPPVNRQEEYLTTLQKAYTDAIVKELIPHIDTTFPTDPRPENRLVMGVSNGGFLSLATAIAYPQVFRNAAGQSSTATEGLANRYRRAAPYTRHILNLYLDCGRYDITGSYKGENYTFLDFNRSFAAMLKETDFTFQYGEYNDGHQWANWRERTESIWLHYFGLNGPLVRND